ncbi:hypothetical protein C1645_743840 [Glomus cerebriforme]|uniref:Uncharacterized protein n=1 Tax=Glomus cerebriforme TaxID=658196 RepID=A0A397SDN4_9GLOM|nr:hypothetical protein C1645_743840 [Glomus cerebriforme]
MASVALGLLTFARNEEDDLKRFIELYKGYINSLGIDLTAGNLVTEIWSDYALEGNTTIWNNRAGMEFTDDSLNYIDSGGVVGGRAGAGHPYVIPARSCHIFIKICADLPIYQMARRQLRFGNLFQEDIPVRKFYDKLKELGSNEILMSWLTYWKELKLERKNYILERISRPVITSQEPVIMKPVTQHGISWEDMDHLLKSQAEIF